MRSLSSPSLGSLRIADDLQGPRWRFIHMAHEGTPMKKIAIAALLTAALVGCGGKSKPATTTTDPATPTGGATYGGATYGAPAADAPAAETPANPCAPK